MYITLFHKAGVLSLSSAALLGWLIALHKADPEAIKKLGIKAPKRILQLHLDQVMMGTILLASGSAFPDLPDFFAGPLLVGTICNPLGFVPLMFSPDAERTMWFRGATGLSFVASTIGFTGLAWHAFHGAVARR